MVIVCVLKLKKKKIDFEFYFTTYIMPDTLKLYSTQYTFLDIFSNSS